MKVECRCRADAVAHLRQAGENVPDDLLAHISLVAWEHIAFSGDFLWDRAAALPPGRRSDADVTLFKSLGLAVEDVAAAHHVYAKAVAAGAGTRVPFGGERADDPA